MNLSRTKIGFFFLTILVLLWFLYPKELFLGLIYEDSEDMRRAESYYLSYLKDHPHNKFASLRLARLYERMADPQRAVKVLKDLYGRRHKDFKVAMEYLDRLRNLNNEELTFREQVEIARAFRSSRRVHAEQVTELLDSAWQYAVWHQKQDEAYNILIDLIVIAPDPTYYKQVLLAYDRGFRRTDRLISTLKAELVSNPKHKEVRDELISLYTVSGRYQEGLVEIKRALKVLPDHPSYLQMRAFIYGKLGRPELAIQDIQQLIAISKDPEELRGFRRELAGLYAQTKKFDEALALYRALWQENPEEKIAWLDLIWILVDLKKVSEAVHCLEGYLRRFPEDDERREDLAQLYLYDQKDGGKLAFYQDFVTRIKQPVFALDVAYLLVEKKQPGKAIAWLEKIYPLYAVTKMATTLADLYIADKDYPKAIALLKPLAAASDRHRLYLAQVYEMADMKVQALSEYQVLRNKSPKRADVILAMAYLEAGLERPPAASALFEEYVRVKGGDLNALKLAGREIFALGNTAKAMEYFDQALSVDERDPEAWFWLAESYHALGMPKSSRRAAEKVVVLLQGRQRGVAQERILLKSRGRIAMVPQVRKDYAQAKKKYPRDREIRSDLIELLLDVRDQDAATSEINDFIVSFPDASKSQRYNQVRVAFLSKDWQGAVTLLKGILTDQPRAHAYRRDLADAYFRAGSWKQAIKEYAWLYRETGDVLRVKKSLREIRERYNHRVAKTFVFQDLGADHLMLWDLNYNGFIAEDWEIGIDFRIGSFSAPAVGFQDEAGEGGVTVSYHPNAAWVIRGGAGVGFSPARTLVFPLVGVSFREERFRFDLDYRLQGLRLDLPQAVAAGDAQDRLNAEVEYVLFGRVVLSGEYRFERDVLPGGDRAFTHTLVPGVAVIVLKRPYVTVGYQYRFTDVDDSGTFLTQVALIPRVNSHTLTALASHTFFERLAVEGGAFAGEDVARDLHLFKGDLFGFRAAVKWQLLSWLDAQSSYEFGRESLASQTGQNHFMSVGLSGHWD